MSGLGVKANRMPVVVRPFRMCSINMDVFPLHILGRIFATPFSRLVFGARDVQHVALHLALLPYCTMHSLWRTYGPPGAARDEEEEHLRTDQGKQQ